ncbi:ricin-type beta-trefoil lectin domain protein [Paraneptunicella aestuarii]|uniref:ricin-type beta-trefoil lectin domain protein n=1 Tax=Paraneptunicella aestuarii TaxID=2831148 RepID=UPI001E4004FF|nr:ricin-type beta-trefoil lectin domain protein [Paraneptunicella aestuarii]UAA40240.1 ricin-type beta-trefoil lectin domain protein [Paraneptunicella aestuarii]
MINFLFNTLKKPSRLACAGILTWMVSVPTQAIVYQTQAVTGAMRFDEAYFLQPHNSYEHDSVLTNWLNKGYRSLELDVIDKGDWELETKGPYVSHDGYAGNENCSASSNDRLGDCLTDILNWIDTNNPDTPIMLFIDMKASWDPLNAWKGDEVKMLDEFVESYIPAHRRFTYKELIQHLQSTDPYFSTSDYRASLKRVGWPTLSSLKGKLIIALTGGYVGDVNARMEQALGYRGDNLATFLCPDIDTTDPEEFSGTIDAISASNSKKFFCGNVKAGDHYTATANRAAEYKQIMHLWDKAGDFANTDFAALWIAIAHGVQGVGIDLSAASSTPSYIGNNIDYVGKRRSLPGYFTIHSVQNTGLCLSDDNTSYGNGSNIEMRYCNNGNEQKFVYSAEGQLRIKGNDKYCVDYSSGSADNGDKMHLWDCDGGNSEKWAITPNGQFKNRDKNYTHCIDIPGGSPYNGQRLQIYSCHSGSNQQFQLNATADWYHNP